MDNFAHQPVPQLDALDDRRAQVSAAPVLATKHPIGRLDDIDVRLASFLHGPRFCEMILGEQRRLVPERAFDGIDDGFNRATEPVPTSHDEP